MSQSAINQFRSRKALKTESKQDAAEAFRPKEHANKPELARCIVHGLVLTVAVREMHR